jgi:hypothetical protein
MFGPLGLEVAGSRLGPGDFGGVKPKQLVECREVLADELGVPPSPETAELHMTILNDERPPAPLGHLRAALPVAYAADDGGSRIAYQVVGDGPVDLVFNPSS